MAPILQWAGLAVLVLLAMVGLYYLYTLYRGYRCLPLTTADCPGNKPHHLVYVDDEELAALAKIAKHTGKPCHGIRSYPPKPKRSKDHQTRTVGVAGGEPIEVDYSPHESVHDFARKFGRKYKETRGVDPPVHFYRENTDDDGEAVVALNVGSSEYLPPPLEDATDFTIVPGDRAWETNMAQFDPAAGEPATYQAVIPAEDQWVKRPSHGPKALEELLVPGARVQFPRSDDVYSEHDYFHLLGDGSFDLRGHNYEADEDGQQAIVYRRFKNDRWPGDLPAVEVELAERVAERERRYGPGMYEGWDTRRIAHMEFEDGNMRVLPSDARELEDDIIREPRQHEAELWRRDRESEIAPDLLYDLVGTSL